MIDPNAAADAEIERLKAALAAAEAERDALRTEVSANVLQIDALARCQCGDDEICAFAKRADAAEAKVKALREALVRLDALYRADQDFGDLPPGGDGRPDWLREALALAPSASPPCAAHSPLPAPREEPPTGPRTRHPG